MTMKTETGAAGARTVARRNQKKAVRRKTKRAKKTN